MGRFDKLEPDSSLPADVKSALGRLNRFHKLEIGASGARPPAKIPCPNCGQPNEKERESCWACYRVLKEKVEAPAAPTPEISVFKGQRVSVIKMDGKVFTSDDPSLAPELKRVFEYVDQNGVTPALMEELRRYGQEVQFKPEADTAFWQEVSDLRTVPEADAEKLKPYTEAMGHFVKQGAKVEDVGDMMAALLVVEPSVARRFVSSQIMAGEIRLTGPERPWPWQSWRVSLPWDATVVYPELCPSCEQRKATRKVRQTYVDINQPRDTGIGIIDLLIVAVSRLLDYYFFARRYEFELPSCEDCAPWYETIGLSRFYWALAVSGTLAGMAEISFWCAAVLPAAQWLRWSWSRFAVDGVGKSSRSYRCNSKAYAELFGLANGLPGSGPEAEPPNPMRKTALLIAVVGGILLLWTLRIALPGLRVLVASFRSIWGIL